jgi:hypothetical protein
VVLILQALPAMAMGLWQRCAWYSPIAYVNDGVIVGASERALFVTTFNLENEIAGD